MTARDDTQSPAGEPTRSIFRNRNFSLLIGGLVISNSGSWMQNVAQGWLVYDLTNSPVSLGLVAITRAVAMIVLPPLGGVMADRMDRLMLLKTTRFMSFVFALIMGLLVAADVIHIWHIFVLSFLSGIVEAFDQPARTALVPNLVRREDLSRAIALHSAAWQGSALIGPSIAGVLIATVGLEVAFFANAVGFLVVVAAVFLMRDVPKRPADAAKKGMTDDFLAGLRFVRSSHLVTMLLLLALVTTVFGRPYQQLLPVFARDVLDSGTAGLGLMMSSMGAGTMAGAAVMSAFGDLGRRGLLLFQMMLFFSGAVIVFTLSRSMTASLVILFVASFTSTIFSTILSTMLQLAVPDEMRGRIMSLTTVCYQGLTPFGALAAGAVATSIGTPNAVMISALVVCAASVLIGATIPSIRNFSPPELRPAKRDEALAAST